MVDNSPMGSLWSLLGTAAQEPPAHQREMLIVDPGTEDGEVYLYQNGSLAAQGSKIEVARRMLKLAPKMRQGGEFWLRKPAVGKEMRVRIPRTPGERARGVHAVMETRDIRKETTP